MLLLGWVISSFLPAVRVGGRLCPPVHVLIYACTQSCNDRLGMVRDGCQRSVDAAPTLPTPCDLRPVGSAALALSWRGVADGDCCINVCVGRVRFQTTIIQCTAVCGKQAVHLQECACMLGHWAAVGTRSWRDTWSSQLVTSTTAQDTPFADQTSKGCGAQRKLHMNQHNDASVRNLKFKQRRGRQAQPIEAPPTPPPPPPAVLPCRTAPGNR